jgi:hypothetical protein
MDANLIVTLILVLVALALLVGGPIMVMRRAATLKSTQEVEAAAFERDLLAATRAPERDSGAGTTSPPPPAPSPQRLGREYPAFGEAPKPTLAGAPNGRRADERTLPNQDPVRAPLPGSSASTSPPAAPRTRSIVDKLTVAGIFKSVEGPLRCANPEIRGTLISLKNGKRLGILESEFDRDDPALDALMRHLDGLIVPGPEGQPLVLKRFQDFLSDLIML